MNADHFARMSSEDIVGWVFPTEGLIDMDDVGVGNSE